MKWVVVADFFKSRETVWLDDFIHDPELSFEKVPSPDGSGDWHSQTGRTTDLAKWRRHCSHAWRALRTAPDGIVTCFPQLAMCVGLLLYLRRRKIPVIAHNFNVGRLAPGLRQRLARIAARNISVFLVHSPSEVAPYAKYLGVSPDRVRFVMLQRGKIDIERDEDTETPFILAMGSAQRDYPTLIEALDSLRFPTVIVTRKDMIEELPKRNWISYRHGLSQVACLELLACARLSVTPVANQSTASGQVTFINAMQMGVPVIATRSPGTEGYLEDGETGYLVESGRPDDLARAIDRLWQDDEERTRVARKAKVFARTQLSDEAAARNLAEILRQVSA